MPSFRRRKKADPAHIAALERETGVASLTETTIAEIDRELDAAKPKRRELVPVPPQDAFSLLAWKVDPAGGLVAEKKPPPPVMNVYATAYGRPLTAAWPVNDPRVGRLYVG